MDTKNHEFWIRQELIPNLIESQAFLLTNDHVTTKNVVLKSCKIKQLSADEVFMLTKCYKVEIVITDADQTNATVHRIIVKVRKMLTEKL